MNQNEFNIEEIRQICNDVIDYLQVEVRNDVQNFQNELNRENNEVNKILQENDNKRKVNSDLMDKIGYAIKLGLNFFAITVLKVDHRFLDYKFHKHKKREVTMKSNSPYLSYIKLFNEVCNSLESVRNVLNNDSQASLMFYRWIVNVGYNNVPIWQDFFNVIEQMGAKVTYSNYDKENTFSVFSKSSLNKTMENGIKNILTNRNRDNKKGINR